MELHKIVSFDGRLGRGAFWGVWLGTVIISSVLGRVLPHQQTLALTLLTTVVGLVLFFIALATTVKRWHDRNKSGLWVLLVFVPLVGVLWSLIELGLLPGTAGENTYGAPASGSPFTRA